MAKPPNVVKLRHRKLKHLEVHLYEDEETGKVSGHLVNWEKGKVTPFKENKEEAEKSPAP